MQLAWLTDIHLNFLRPNEAEEFFAELRKSPADAMMLTGDVSDAVEVSADLRRLDDAWQRPLYFVLGNHDFYGGSIAGVRAAVRQLCAERPRLVYLTSGEPIELAPGVGLIGNDGWADARFGDYEKSYVMMNDYRLIAELAGMTKAERWPKLKALGDEAAAEIRRLLPAALERFQRVLVATHLPPLREACWHEGQISDDEWAPHFTCKAIGDALLEIAPEFPKCEVTVYCGHTHSPGLTRPQPNLTIYTGGSEYGKPHIQKLITL
jgi:3',5'-cyclic AMP phosphodiesterase CpdA